MALSRTSVKCLLCQGSVSISSGDLDKMKLHMENDHDIFYQKDLIIALNFLEEFEREEIVEKGLPRMKVIFDNIKKFNMNKLSLKRGFHDVPENEQMIRSQEKKVKLTEVIMNNNDEGLGDDHDSEAERKPEEVQEGGKGDGDKFSYLDVEVSSDDDDDNLETFIDKPDAASSSGDQEEVVLRKSEAEISDDDGSNFTATVQTLKHQIKALQAASNGIMETTAADGRNGKKIKKLGKKRRKILNDEHVPSTDQRSSLKRMPLTRCDLCNKDYATKSTMKKHRKICLRLQNAAMKVDDNSTIDETEGMLEEEEKREIKGSPVSEGPLIKIKNSSTILYSASKKASKVGENSKSPSLPKPPLSNPLVSASTKSHSKKAKSSACKFCGKMMLNSNLSRHVKRHHNENEDINDSEEDPPQVVKEVVHLKCKLCNDPAQSIEELRKHSSEVHDLDYDDIEKMLGGENSTSTLNEERPEKPKADKEEVKDKTRVRQNVLIKKEIMDEMLISGKI